MEEAPTVLLINTGLHKIHTHMNHSIVYIMRHVDIGGNVEIPYKKIGITGAGESSLDSRLRQISNTKSPIKAQFVAAWEHNDASQVERALHDLLEDSRVEGEWFLDANDTLQDRMSNIMNLLEAKSLSIEESNDAQTQNLKLQESVSRESLWNQLVGEIAQLIDNPLRSSVRQAGPTFFSDKTNLTYYVNARKCGIHHMGIGRSKDRFDEIDQLLETTDYTVEQETGGAVRLINLSNEMVAGAINYLENKLQNKSQ